MAAVARNEKVLCLFDVDGTLTEARLKITSDTKEFISQLRKKCVVGTVGGSDFKKQKEQLGDDVQDCFDFCFAENGLTAFKGRDSLGSTSFVEYLGEDNMKELLNYILGYLSKTDTPVKRGTFVEWRNGMLNVSPIGRACSRAERAAFYEWDKKSGCREKMVKELTEKFGERLKIKFAIGGQISFDVFPIGWDKTYCLRYLEGQFDEIHFFGDKTYEGGNDFEIFTDKRTIGHSVKDPEDTKKQLRELFF